VLYGVTFFLAFCSIVYELLLGQTLSAFLGNTVLRYSVTVGLFLLAKGLGALLVEGWVARHPIVALLAVEWGLSILGGSSVVALHLMDGAQWSPAVLSVTGHGLIILIGALTGCELPLLILAQGRRHPGREHRMLAADYAGALVGVLGFAFLFYPVVGLLPTAFWVAALNVAAALALLTQGRGVDRSLAKPYAGLLSAHGVLLAVLTACVWHASRLEEHFLHLYLRTPGR
jgi:spermidine synthase